MITIPVRNVLDTDTRAAGFWTSADRQATIDMRGATLAEARKELLAQCATDEERAAMLAGSIEVME